jgi:hypothetical protein
MNGENGFEIELLLFKKRFIDLRIASLTRDLLTLMELTTWQSTILV